MYGMASEHGEYVVFVDARLKWNGTGIHLKPGVRYRLTPDLNYEWRDARRHCGAAGWSSRWFSWFHIFKRNRSANWLGLVAMIGNEEAFVFLDDEASITVEPSVGGHLRFYANDIGIMYWNNSDQLQVTITEVAEPEANPPANHGDDGDESD